MRRVLFVLLVVAVMGCLTPVFAGTCPAAGYASDCNVLATFNSNGSVSITYPASTPYDGSDDMMIGVVNNTASTLNSLVFSGSGNGGGAFMFDGDGACAYGPSCNHPALGSYVSVWGDNGYWDQGSGVWFTNVNAAEDTGTINFFGGIAPGGSAWFSLESAVGSGPIVITSAEPGTLVMLGMGLVGLILRRRREA
jgi:hypothetical protein